MPALEANTLRLAAAVELQAASGDRPARVSILAYSGGSMTVAGYGPVAIDLAGLEMPATLPLLGDHNSNLDGVAGSGSPRVQSGVLTVDGTLAPSPMGARIRDLAAAGVPLQASVGVMPTDRLAVRAGDTVQLNGREIKAGPNGLTVIRAGILREVSITPLGADSATSVAIAAKDPTMPDAPTTTPPTADPIAAERQRMRAIIEATEGHPDIRARALDGGWPVDRVKATLFDLADKSDALAKLRASRAPAPSSPAGPPSRPTRARCWSPPASWPGVMASWSPRCSRTGSASPTARPPPVAGRNWSPWRSPSKGSRFRMIASRC